MIYTVHKKAIQPLKILPKNKNKPEMTKNQVHFPEKILKW